MKPGLAGAFGVRLRSLREAAGFTQEELATIAGLSVHAVSALERGHRRRPQLETVRALSTALALPAAARDALLRAARTAGSPAVAAESDGVMLPHILTPLVGREADVHTLTGWLDDPAARLITLVGTGRGGKAPLRLAIAHGVADAQTMRVVFGGPPPTPDAPFVASAI